MRKTTKLFFFLVILTFFSFNITNIKASLEPIYPTWGYNEENHICQVKQENADSPINENLSGNYSDIRECRYDNPEIIFYTGGGILIWLSIFLFAFLLHYLIIPKFKKRNQTEKILFFLQDIIIIGFILFILILLQHFFDIPKASYSYLANIDHIIYSTLIRDQVPKIFAIIYLIISLIKLTLIYLKNKK